MNPTFNVVQRRRWAKTLLGGVERGEEVSRANSTKTRDSIFIWLDS